MIDLETMGNKSRAVVVSIGAVFFDDDKGKLGDTFYRVLSVKEQTDKGREINADTFKWWMKQSDEARSIFQEESSKTYDVLQEFSEFIFNNAGENCMPWGNGASFDITIMETLYQDFGLSIPWKFRNIRDLRTYSEYVYNGKDLKRKGTYHNALDDAIYQAQVVINGMKSSF